MAGDSDPDFLLQTCASCLPAAICKKDGWTLICANAALRALLGHENGSLPGDILDRWLAEGSIGTSGSNSQCGAFNFHTSQGQFYLVRWQNIPSGEPWRHVSIMPLPPAHGGESPREMDSILDFIHDGIWIIDGNGITLRINRAMERIAGIHASEVVGRHVSEPLREGRFKTCVSLRALEARHTVTLFDDYSNGKRCLNTSTPVFDANGNVWRVIAAIRDITELETLQSRLSDLEVEAMAFRLRVQGLESQTQNGMLGQSPALQRVIQDISRAAHTDAVTLILGETGTGKTLAAKTIHEMGDRAQKPFVSLNCGAIPASLMESELFGYERGAFTGAARGGKPGMFELAAGGTLLLDEIGELSLPMQAKLLHVLDGQPIYRVGGTRPITMGARILAATNRSLEKMVAAGTFREDLFYRLRVLCVELPPLRERRDDILFLAWHFLRQASGDSGRAKILDPRAEQLFLAYAWPGNVRELQSVIQSLATLCVHEKITPADLPSYMRENYETGQRHPMGTRSLTEAVEEVEREMIANALAETGSTYKAARRLGISQSSVMRKARKYGIPTAHDVEPPKTYSGRQSDSDTLPIEGRQGWKH